ncbi:MAG: VanZ family protein [Deltaproteobacteria bacterium]|nr:VanZ family protein [Deltaproteobacteria bacterium]MBZ0219595.1 VanZ family protein [Deltaproteobacteria bacterium]
MSAFRGWGPVLPYALLIMVLSLLPSSEAEEHIIGVDKVYHALAYAGLAWLLMRALSASMPGWKASAVLAAFLAASVFGAFIEFLQSALTDTRTADIYDAVANGMGAAFGSIAYRVARPIKKVSHTSPEARR